MKLYPYKKSVSHAELGGGGGGHRKFWDSLNTGD